MSLSLYILLGNVDAVGFQGAGDLFNASTVHRSEVDPLGNRSKVFVLASVRKWSPDRHLSGLRVEISTAFEGVEEIPVAGDAGKYAKLNLREVCPYQLLAFRCSDTSTPVA